MSVRNHVFSFSAIKVIFCWGSLIFLQALFDKSNRACRYLKALLGCLTKQRPGWPQVAVQCSTHSWSSVYRVYNFVQLDPSQFCYQIISMQNTYEQFDSSLRVIRSSGQQYVRLRAIKSSGEECHCQPLRTNIGDKFKLKYWGWRRKAKTEDHFKSNC